MELLGCTTWDLIRSASTDPAVNLAWEETLFRRRGGDRGILFLYRNRSCVVLGRNQNPWVECDVRWVRVSKETYDTLEAHRTRMQIWTHPGRLGHEWFDGYRVRE